MHHVSLAELMALPPPQPWAEGDNIPWDAPEFSARMLSEHLSQDHDAASRRSSVIADQVEWIHGVMLGGNRSRILDLACGPGLYTRELARRGHSCHGIDYSPASIEYATSAAASEGLPCTYTRADLRTADFGNGYDLVMLTYGEFNVFRKVHAGLILTKAHAALARGGKLLLEPHTADAIREKGQRPQTWYATQRGLFSDFPHICLQQQRWDAKSCTATIRYAILNANGGISVYGQTFQAYANDEYLDVVRGPGFVGVEIMPSLTGDDVGDGLMAIAAARE